VHAWRDSDLVADTDTEPDAVAISDADADADSDTPAVTDAHRPAADADRSLTQPDADS
jgi:hypothetical protein